MGRLLWKLRAFCTVRTCHNIVRKLKTTYMWLVGGLPVRGCGEMHTAFRSGERTEYLGDLEVDGR